MSAAFPRIAMVTVALLLCRAAAQDHPEQKVHRASFTPVGDEAFDVITESYEYDADWPLDARRVDEWTTEHARFEKIVFTTSTRERVPGDLALPLEGEGPFPCVVLLHGLGSNRDRWWQPDREALPRGLLAAGIAVLTIDLRYHGERTAENDYQSPVYLTLNNTLFVRSRNMLIQSAIDARRALDYLRSRDDIAAGRIAVVGYSMGGMIAVTLSVLEDLAAAVTCAVPTGEQPATVDPFNFAPRSNTPTLLLIGRTDWMSSPADAKMLRDLMPIEDRKLMLYDAGHRLPPQFVQDAVLWLTARLRQ